MGCAFFYAASQCACLGSPHASAYAAFELPDCSWVASRMLVVKLPAWALPGLPSGPVI